MEKHTQSSQADLSLFIVMAFDWEKKESNKGQLCQHPLTPNKHPWWDLTEKIYTSRTVKYPQTQMWRHAQWKVETVSPI